MNTESSEEEEEEEEVAEKRAEVKRRDSLKSLLEEYIRKSEELERRESKVLKKVDLMQLAVASLQEWSGSRKASDSVRTVVKEMDEETRQIKEETKQIQEEVKQKQEDNRKLEEAVRKKNTERIEVEDFVKKIDDFMLMEKAGGQEIEAWALGPSAPPDSGKEDAGLRFFHEKLEKLKDLEKRLRKESEAETEQARVRRTTLRHKMENLERELEVDRQRILGRKGKPGEVDNS